MSGSPDVRIPSRASSAVSSPSVSQAFFDPHSHAQLSVFGDTLEYYNRNAAEVARGHDSAGEGRDTRGRFMILRPASRVRLLFERLGFVLQSEWNSADAASRPDVSWTSLLFRCSGKVPRAVDRLESILNADRKVATYKLALIRALCDLALAGYNTVSWTSDGSVAVPLRAVAELWVRYYWPLFESAEVIPQINAETKGGKARRVQGGSDESRRALPNARGLSAFARDSLQGRLGAEGSRLYARSLRSIGSVIVKGPVQYSGGAIGRQEFHYCLLFNRGIVPIRR